MSVYSSSVCAHNTTVDLPPPPSPSHRFTFTQYCNEIINCIVSKVMCICPVCTTPRLFRLTGARRAPRSSFTAPEGRLKTCIYILQMNYSSKAMYVCIYSIESVKTEQVVVTRSLTSKANRMYVCTCVRVCCQCMGSFISADVCFR